MNPESEVQSAALPELQVKRILVPVDFSPSSRKALSYAVAFARQFSAELLLLNVVEIVPPPPELIIPDTELLDRSLHEVAEKRLAEWHQTVAPKVAARAEVRTGSPYREIVQAAAESNIDLIIVGSHDRKALTRVFLGSTAERVVRHAPCPVMIVREREHDFLQEDESQPKPPTIAA